MTFNSPASQRKGGDNISGESSGTRIVGNSTAQGGESHRCIVIFNDNVKSVRIALPQVLELMRESGSSVRIEESLIVARASFFLMTSKRMRDVISEAPKSDPTKKAD